MKKVPKYNIEFTLEDLLFIGGALENVPDGKEIIEIREKVRKKVLNILKEDPEQEEVLKSVLKKI